MEALARRRAAVRVSPRRILAVHGYASRPALSGVAVGRGPRALEDVVSDGSWRIRSHAISMRCWRCTGDLWERAARRAHLHHRRDRVLRLLAARDAALGERAPELGASAVVLTRDAGAFAREGAAPGGSSGCHAVTTATSAPSRFRPGRSRTSFTRPRIASRPRRGDRRRCSTRSSTARAATLEFARASRREAVPADQFRRGLRPPAGRGLDVPEDYRGAPGSEPSGERLRRGEARRGDAVRDLRGPRICSRRSRGASRSSGRTCRSTCTSRSATSFATHLQGGPIRVSGDGTPYRSYLYARRPRGLALDDSRCAAGRFAPYNVGLRNCDLDCRCGTPRRARGGGRGERPDRRHAAAGRGGTALRAQHGQSARRSSALTMSVELADAHRPGPRTGIGAGRPSMSNTERALQIGISPHRWRRALLRDRRGRHQPQRRPPRSPSSSSTRPPTPAPTR